MMPETISDRNKTQYRVTRFSRFRSKLYMLYYDWLKISKKVTKRPYNIPDDVNIWLSFGFSIHFFSGYVKGYKPYVDTQKLTRFVCVRWSLPYETFFSPTFPTNLHIIHAYHDRRIWPKTEYSIRFKLYVVKDPGKVRIERNEKKHQRAYRRKQAKEKLLSFVGMRG